MHGATVQIKLAVLFYEIKKYIYCYLKCIVYGKLLKHRQSFRITLYFILYWACCNKCGGYTFQYVHSATVVQLGKLCA